MLGCRRAKGDIKMKPKVMERPDITELSHKRETERAKHPLLYKKEYVEIDGVLYIDYSYCGYYESCSKEHLDFLGITEFDQPNKNILICKCLNKYKFEIYRWGYEGLARCLECGNEICIHEG